MNNNNIKRKPDRNPFKARNQGQPRVGNTIGERKLLQQKPQVTPIPVRRKQIDQFSRNSKKPKNLANFAPNTTVSSGSSQTVRGIPHKKSIHHHIEKGTAPVVTSYQSPPDPALLKFLKRIIETPQLHNSVRLRKAYAARKADQKRNVNKTATKKTNPRQYPMGQPAARTQATAPVQTRPIRPIRK